MAESSGFWSYVHADDEAERGRIAQLARDVVAQYELLTGETISLFLDRDAIEWGEKWRAKIDETLAEVAFFIPVLTPRFFMSPECRRELRFFARNATLLGVKDLVLPLLYVDVPALRKDEPEDDLVAMLKDFQWQDWKDLRFCATTSEGYRRGVASLAVRIAEANKAAEEVDIAHANEETENADIVEGDSGEAPERAAGTVAVGLDETPGVLDRLAVAEDALPQWTETLEGITEDVGLMGQIMAAGTDDIRRGTDQGHGFAARLRVTQRVARELAEPIERIWLRGNDFASLLHDVDDGIRLIIDEGTREVLEHGDSEEALCKFFGSLRHMSVATIDGLRSVGTMIDAIEPIEKTSRDMRPVMRRLRQGLTTMVEAGEVSNEWVGLIEASGVECE